MKLKFFNPELITDEDIYTTEELTTLGYNVIICPVCGNKTLDDYYICPHCGWEYDGHTKLNRKSFANNGATIKKYKKEYLRWKKKCLKKKNI